MHRYRLFPLLVLGLALPALAEEPAPQMTPEEQAMMAAYQAAATPGPQHAHLASAQGKYVLTVRSWQAPDAPPSEETGEATRRMTLGGRVMIEEVQSSMMGQPFTGLGLTGYDNVKGKYWSTWNDSMGTGLMVSEGDCDAAGRCTFTGRWTDPVTKTETVARMVSHWAGPDTEVFEMYGAGPDGQEMKIMELTYQRISR